MPSATEARERARIEDEVRLRPEQSELIAMVDAPIWDKAIQPNAIDEDGDLDWGNAVVILRVKSRERYAIREGDVLMPLRSQRIRAVVATEVPRGIIASGSWALITPDKDRLRADYLAWYLNHPRTRARLAAAMTGSSLQFLTMSAVHDFEIDLPSPEVQRRIGRAATQLSRVAQLERRLTRTRQQLLDAAAIEAIDRDTP